MAGIASISIRDVPVVSKFIIAAGELIHEADEELDDWHTLRGTLKAAMEALERLENLADES